MTYIYVYYSYYQNNYKNQNCPKFHWLFPLPCICASKIFLISWAQFSAERIGVWSWIYLSWRVVPSPFARKRKETAVSFTLLSASSSLQRKNNAICVEETSVINHNILLMVQKSGVHQLIYGSLAPSSTVFWFYIPPVTFHPSAPFLLDPVPQTSKRFRLQGLAAEVLRHLGGVGDMGVVDSPMVECQPSHEGFK